MGRNNSAGLLWSVEVQHHKYQHIFLIDMMSGLLFIYLVCLMFMQIEI